MENTKTLQRNLRRVAWGLLAILWGGTILFDFIHFGVGLIGTGLIFLGVNVVRSVNQLHAKNDNTVLGILAVTWGGLELMRPQLRQLFPSADLDGVIFAMMLIEFGFILLTCAVLLSQRKQSGAFSEAEE